MKKIFYLSIAFIGFSIYPNVNMLAQGVGINATGAPADNSAGLDVNFNNKGALLPRLNTDAQNSIATPANGLTIYNTDCGTYNYNAGTPVSPNWVSINPNNSLAASVSITSNPANGAICDAATFTATPAAGLNAGYITYQWQLNGSSINGANSSNYTASNQSSPPLANNQVYSCILTSSQMCATGSPATSNSITVIKGTVPAEPGAITPPSAICATTAGNVFSIASVAGATHYNWVLPDAISTYAAYVTAGAGTNSITVTLGDSVGVIGNIAVSAANDCGASAFQTYAITTTALAVEPAIPTGNTGGIEGTTGNYSISPTANSDSYSWFITGNGLVTIGQGSTQVTVLYPTGTTTTTIYVEGVSNVCGPTQQDSVVVALCAQTHGSRTFSYTGSVQAYTVPCTYSMTITANGGGGGDDGCCNYGYGATASGSLAVSPNQVLYMYVGAQGGYVSYGWPDGGYGGYNGGYGGGGSSSVSTSSSQTNYSARVLIAGGGGGSTGYGSQGGGGGTSNGGTATNSNTQNYSRCQTSSCYFYCGYSCSNYSEYATGGTGGTQGGGGSGGSYNAPYYSGWSGQSGGYGYGGNQNEGDPYYDGGGGGGYYGGGSGATNSYNDWSSGGGGGSSYIGGVSSGSWSSSTTGGNGSITVTW